MLLSNASPAPIQMLRFTFQSLFYWMLLSNQRPFLYLRTQRCFNPCFIGCYSLTGGAQPDKRYSMMFQSLFYWMLLSNKSMEMSCSILWRTSFNPCFIGCYSLTAYGLRDYQLQVCFNPCFIGCYSLTLSSTFITKQFPDLCRYAPNELITSCIIPSASPPRNHAKLTSQSQRNQESDN